MFRYNLSTTDQLTDLSMPVCRRKPSQDRSREKFDVILKAAKELIGERGNDAVSMREIAKAAGVAPSSIYQYFPDKNAILAAIMEGYFEQIQQMLNEVVEGVTSVSDLPLALDAAVDRYYQMFLDEPTLATIWAGIQANTVLRELDARDSEDKAHRLADILCQLAPEVEVSEAFYASLLLVQMIGVTVRMSLAMPESSAQRLLQEFKLLARLRILEFMGVDTKLS